MGKEQIAVEREGRRCASSGGEWLSIKYRLADYRSFSFSKIPISPTALNMSGNIPKDYRNLPRHLEVNYVTNSSLTS
ncbi:Hypothetical predicted protein [Octopus vulgaris]|uniref:Uncharacterized protein n=1 Tax=Octopus vulgaris TaxID=6645 RepID=A0AA36FIS9_OCTVU|nr:Hypothetical predicted protein [Octopus vulgaris]